MCQWGSGQVLFEHPLVHVRPGLQPKALSYNGDGNTNEPGRRVPSISEGWDCMHTHTQSPPKIIDAALLS